MTARYPISIESGTERTAFGVIVPDLPGCFSAGATLDEAMKGVEEAVAACIDAALDLGEAIPGPSSLQVIQADAAYAGWTFAVVSVDPGLLDDTIERVNITLPRRVLYRRRADLTRTLHAPHPEPTAERGRVEGCSRALTSGPACFDTALRAGSA